MVLLESFPMNNEEQEQEVKLFFVTKYNIYFSFAAHCVVI